MTLTALIANEWWPRGSEGSQGEADFFRIAQPNKTKSERLSVQAILLHKIICEVQVTHCIQAACKSYDRSLLPQVLLQKVKTAEIAQATNLQQRDTQESNLLMQQELVMVNWGKTEREP